MTQKEYGYVIVGAGLAGASAVEGIRELDQTEAVLMLGRESELPYERPPLSKKLWFGKEKVEDIFIQDQAFYRDRGVELKSGVEVIGIDPARKELRDRNGRTYRFGKLLLATGGNPRVLDIPGGRLDGVCYYRTLGDYRKVREIAEKGKSAVILGGGFIGSEMAAALRVNQLEVTLIFPGAYLVQRVFPESLGSAMQNHYRSRGIRVLSQDSPVSIERIGDRFVTSTRGGERIESEIVIAGVGIDPSAELAAAAGLSVGNGVLVDEYLQTSHPDIYAAGDNANFPYLALGQRMRVEHWDNALNQGKQAGRNMAGARERYAHLPYFFSDLFEFGYEAVGEVDSRLETAADWRKENDTGVIYYARDGKVRGAMMCNIWNQVDWARELIRKGVQISPGNLPRLAA